MCELKINNKQDKLIVLQQLKCDLFSMIRRNLIIMDQVKKLTEPGRQFAKDSIRLVKRCTKPDRKGIRNMSVM